MIEQNPLLGSFSLQFLLSSEEPFYENFLAFRILIQTLSFLGRLPTRQDGFQNRDKVQHKEAFLVSRQESFLIGNSLFRFRWRAFDMVHSKEFANKLDFVYKMRQRVISKTTGARVSTETPSSRSKCTAHLYRHLHRGIFCHDLVTQLYMLTCQIQSNWRGTGDLQLEKVKELEVNLNIFLFVLTPLSCLR